jgi:hypothetical protein
MFARRINARTIVGFGDCATPRIRLKANPSGTAARGEEVFRIAPFFDIHSTPPKHRRVRRWARRDGGPRSDHDSGCQAKKKS